jgi:hypothetical protein
MRGLIDYGAAGEKRQFRAAPFQHGARVRLCVLRIERKVTCIISFMIIMLRKKNY